MTDWVDNLAHRRVFWLTLATLALFMEAAALYYQYVLNYYPCMVCIHIRLVIAGFALLWLAAGINPGSGWLRWTGIVGSFLISIVFIERSWQLLAIEYGWVFSSCEMTLGLPSWAAVDRWMPWQFEVQEPCGVTPFVIGRISMAEVLMANAAISLLLFAALIVASAWRYQRTR